MLAAEDVWFSLWEPGPTTGDVGGRDAMAFGLEKLTNSFFGGASFVLSFFLGRRCVRNRAFADRSKRPNRSEEDLLGSRLASFVCWSLSRGESISEHVSVHGERRCGILVAAACHATGGRHLPAEIATLLSSGEADSLTRLRRGFVCV